MQRNNQIKNNLIGHFKKVFKLPEIVILLLYIAHHLQFPLKLIAILMKLMI